MILRNKLNTLTEEECAVLMYSVNAALPEGVSYRPDDLKLLKPTWLFTALRAAGRLIKPEHISILESLEKKLL